jgi:hypothetical protein
MRPILSRSGPNIELNALFIQPTRWCGLNCDGCYVKAHTDGEDGHHVEWYELKKLFNLFYNGPHWANQITIAVDDLPIDGNRVHHMILLVDTILELVTKDKRPRSECPEVHMTLHTLNTLKEYEEENVRDFHHLDMISFSELAPTQATKDKIAWLHDNGRTTVNYNKMAPLSWKSVDMEVERLATVGGWVDHIYLVMQKTPVGHPEKALATSVSPSYWSSYQLYISEVVDKLPVDVRRKVTIDGCFSDTIKHSRTGYGCASNVSRVQVWPDGTVSGCPYAHAGSTPIGLTAEDILGNIRGAQRQYDFKEKCHLPTVYSTVSRGSGLRILQV